MTAHSAEYQIRIKLDSNDKGVPFPNHSNIVYVLQHDPAYGVECLWYDEFLDRVIVANSPIRPWKDDDDTKAAVDMQSRFGIRSVSLHVVASAVQYVARQRTRHVVREWLQSLVWDDTARIAHAFSDYWGAADDEYTRAASRNFFIGMAARILQPGCKLDTMPVFEGPQGVKKSTALEILGGEWYSASHETVGSLDFLQGLRGKWLIEIPELQGFTKADIRAVKNTLSRRADDYRKSYGRQHANYPRASVFAGTTNTYDWGEDETGLRRFWPIRCGDIATDLLLAARPQLFAEAVHAIHTHATWWEMPAQTAAIQASRQFRHEWTHTILDWCDLQPLDDGVMIRDILLGPLKFEISRIGDKRSQMLVAKILTLSGWQGKDEWKNGRTAKVWRKVDTQGGNSEGSNEVERF